ncbi:fungal specific transcription factor domain-containing protein [Colletotrichum sojae]|uniref:Fungal specific transcription factor domain-containing protein n=1 Tax=Colletotrichum sojae TaxID=2175907 RepID=A0A8H6MJH9_9PEZI|nr:fungal specific transcription factor domain-containing protein [Colletotrichum sojae]
MLDESAFWGGYFGLLFTHDAESSPVAIAQAALLLNFQTSPTETAPKVTTGRSKSTIWLAVPNQNATSAATNLGDVDKCTLNRLRWCCFIRDRLLALGENRQPLIASENFDFYQEVEHGVDALQEELKRSRVYAPETRSRMADIIGDMLRLCIFMTDTLVLAFGT